MMEAWIGLHPSWASSRGNTLRYVWFATLITWGTAQHFYAGFGKGQGVDLLRSGGQRDRDHAVVLGQNTRADEIQAAILNYKLAHLKEWNERLGPLAALYIQRLWLPGLRWQTVPEGREHVYHLFVVRYSPRDRLRACLRNKGIGTTIHYEAPLHKQPAIRCDFQPSLPEAEHAAEEVLSLALRPTLSLVDVAEEANTVNEFAVVTA